MKTRAKQVHELLLVQWGDNVRSRRSALGLTQAQVAERAAVDQGDLSRIERGARRGLTLDVILRLAVALECEPSDICPWPVAVGPAVAQEIGAPA